VASSTSDELLLVHFREASLDTLNLIFNSLDIHRKLLQWGSTRHTFHYRTDLVLCIGLLTTM
jgi:hypothetical protein